MIWLLFICTLCSVRISGSPAAVYVQPNSSVLKKLWAIVNFQKQKRKREEGMEQEEEGEDSTGFKHGSTQYVKTSTASTEFL